MKLTKTTLAAVAATGVIGLVAVPVLAQEPDDATTDATATEEVDVADAPDDWADRQAAHEARRAAMIEELAGDLAAELDIGEDEVAAALATVMDARQAERRAERQAQRQERLDAAVEDGTLTQEQADALAELSGGHLGLGGPGGLDGPGGPGGFGGRGHGGPGVDGGGLGFGG